MLALLFIMGLQPLSARDRLQVIDDSIKALGADIRALQNKNETLLNSIKDTSPLIHNQDSIIRDLESQIEIEKITVDSLEIKRKDATIKKMNEEIESNNGNFIVIATNFLYVPYNKENISLALDTYKLAEGSNVYTKYQIRKKLLNDYEQDTKELKEFLANNTQEKITTLKFIEITKAFNDLTPVKDYPQYGNGWEELYLGSIINDINSALKKAEDPKNAVDLDKVFTDNLKKLR